MTTALSRQCRESQYTVLSIIETAGDNEALLFEALNVNDEIQKVLSKYEDMKKPVAVPQEPQPVLIPVAVEPDDSQVAEEEEALIRKQHSAGSGVRGRSIDDVMDNLDSVFFGKTTNSSSEAAEGTKVKQPTRYDPVAN